MSDSQQGFRKFRPIENRKEQLRLLSESVKLFVSTIIWTKDQDMVIESHLSHYSATDNWIYAWPPKDFNGPDFIDTLARKGNSDCFFSLSHPRANLFFRAQFLLEDPKLGLRFAVPEMIFKVQRRENVRMPIRAGYVLRVNFPDPLNPTKILDKKTLDISAGGLSFLIEEEDLPLYPQGMILKDLRFKIHQREIRADVEVRNSRVLPTTSQESGIGIGVQFTRISAADSHVIASYILDESRKFFFQHL